MSIKETVIFCVVNAINGAVICGEIAVVVLATQEIDNKGKTVNNKNRLCEGEIEGRIVFVPGNRSLFTMTKP